MCLPNILHHFHVSNGKPKSVKSLFGSYTRKFTSSYLQNVASMAYI